MKSRVKKTLCAYTIDVSSRRIKGEKNGCGSLNVANCTIRSEQVNVKTGIISPALTV